MSQAGAAEATGNSFKQLTNYLSDLPNEEKRRAAMDLQSTPQGRSMSNSDAKDDWWSNTTRDVK
jgi:hypothetical protein